MMDLDSYTSDGRVRQWELVHGDARCVSDALAPTDPGAAVALGRNALISTLLAEVAGYQAAARVEEAPLDAPDYEQHLAAYTAAREIVEGAGTAVQALARIRAGELDEGDEATLAAVLAEAQPIAPVVPVPQAVSPLQMRKALRATGLKAAVDQFVTGADDETREAYEYAIEYLRTDPLINGAAQMLGKSEAELDDLFRLAVSL